MRVNSMIMDVEERFKSLKGEFDLFLGVKDIGIKEVRDLMLDSEVKKGSGAESYILKNLKIPASYFHNVSEAHKMEIMDNARNTFPDYRARVLVKDRELIAAGPVIDFPFTSIPNFLEKEFKSVKNIVGSVSRGSSVRVFESLFDAEISKDYYVLGLDMEISSLFCTGVKIKPCLLQLICLNGLVDVKEISLESTIKAVTVSFEALECGIAATRIILSNKGKFFGVLESLDIHAPLTSIEMKNSLEKDRFPKSFIEKVVNLTGRIETRKDKIEEPIPVEIRNLRDNLSIMSYVAQSFGDKTRLNLETGLLNWARNQLN